MIIRKHSYVLDVDVEGTSKYSQEHEICDCNEDRNLHAQIADKFPKLKEFLAELGLLIERPDETGSCAVEDYIDYHFVSYTVIGKILESDTYEIDMFDGGLFLNIVIDNWYVPNEQKTDKYFKYKLGMERRSRRKNMRIFFPFPGFLRRQLCLH